MRKSLRILWAIDSIALAWLFGYMILYGSNSERAALAGDLGVIWGVLAVICGWMFWKSKQSRHLRKTAITQGVPSTDEDDTLPVESVEDSTFVVDNEDPSRVTIDIDVDLHWKSLSNHFRLDSRYDTCFGKSLYEYRIDGTEMFYRLIEDQSDDIGRPEERDVRDGVVQESAIHERSENKPYYVRSPDEKIASLKQQVEWQKLNSWGFRGFKYYVLLKKLPRPEARRFLRQELERLKVGTAAFFKEAEKYGLEQDDNALSLDRLRFAEGRPRPTNEEIKKLYDSTETFGITQLEFSWGKKLTALLER